MLSLRFTHIAGRGLVTADLPLRMPQASGVIDPEPFRVAAAGGAPLRDAMAPCRGMRTLALRKGDATPLFDLAGPLLTFVITGVVEVDTGDRGTITLGRGDMFLVDAGAEIEGLVRGMGGCRLLQVAVDAEWPGDRARPPRQAQATGGNVEPNFKRMFKAADNRSRFRDFPELFGPPGAWSALNPVEGLRFIGMAEDTFIDWHPEVTNNLVIVLSGALELEVGGGPGEVQVFRPGDVCLAEDRTGEGHIDRVQARVEVAVLVIADAHLPKIAGK